MWTETTCKRKLDYVILLYFTQLPFHTPPNPIINNSPYNEIQEEKIKILKSLMCSNLIEYNKERVLLNYFSNLYKL